MLHDLDLYKEYYEGSNSGSAKWALKALPDRPQPPKTRPIWSFWPWDGR